MALSDDIRTPDGFVERLHSMAPKVFAQAVADFTDADRRKLSKVAQEHAKALQKKDRQATTLAGIPTAEMMRRAMGQHERKNVALATAHLGLLAVAPKSANLVALPSAHSRAQAWQATEPTEHEAAAITILLDRRPDWAQQWLERQLQPTDFGFPLKWESVRRLLDGQLCEAPDTVEFASLVQSVILRADLAEQPDLVEYGWFQFCHSTGFLVSDGKLQLRQEAVIKQGWLPGAEWLWSQVNAGLIDRARVVDECLAAYWRDFNNAERSTLGKLLEALQLTDAEFVARQAEFRKLLSHESPAVVTFALKCFKAKKKADGLDADLLVAELPQTFSISTKTQPKSALVLLKSITGKSNERRNAAAEVAAGALQHAEIDVQEAAVKLLEGWAKTHVPVETLQQVSELPPTIQTRVEALLVAAGVDVDSPAKAEDLPPTDETASELFRKIEGCMQRDREVLSLDESLAAATRGTMLPSVDIDQLPVNLKALSPVDPVQSVEELIDEVDHVIGNLQSPMPIERVLDGTSRFGADYPDGFNERVAPIRARFESDGDQIPLFQGAMFFPSTYGLMFDWLRKKLEAPAALPRFLRWSSVDPPDMAKALDLRAVELRRSFLQSGSTLPLLSLPTHEHGWIEPNEFVSRLRHYVDASRAICPIGPKNGRQCIGPPTQTEACAAAWYSCSSEWTTTHPAGNHPRRHCGRCSGLNDRGRLRR